MQPERETSGRRTTQRTPETTGERARKTARVSAATAEAAGGGAAEPAPGTANGRTAACRSQPQTTSSAGETGTPDGIMKIPMIDNQGPVAAIRGSVIDVRLPQRLPNINHLNEMGEWR